jgi:hypothetical protein
MILGSSAYAVQVPKGAVPPAQPLRRRTDPGKPVSTMSTPSQSWTYISLSGMHRTLNPAALVSPRGRGGAKRGREDTRDEETEERHATRARSGSGSAG